MKRPARTKGAPTTNAKVLGEMLRLASRILNRTVRRALKNELRLYIRLAGLAGGHPGRPRA